MVELVYGTVLGALAAGIFTLYVRSRSLSRQLDALRAEVAMARIEGVLADGGDVAPPEVVRRKGHLGLVRRTGALAGLALGSVGWVRSHRIASTGAAATVAAVAVGAVYLGGPEPRRSEPAPPGPTPEAALSPTLPAYETAPSSTPSAGSRPRSSRAVATPSPSGTAGALADLIDLVSLLPVVPVPVPSVLSVPSVDVSLAPTPMPSRSLPCVHATLGPAEAEACVTR